MALTPPRTLSPSKVSTFTKCALAFRFSAIDKVSEPPSEPATKGTLVHTALERLFTLAPQERTRDAAQQCLHDATTHIRDDPDFTGLHLDAASETAFLDDAAVLVDRYFELEDPTLIRPIGLELMVEVPREGYAQRGIIDRLELDDEGGLVITDYKTGRPPSERFESASLEGVHFYAAMCEQLLGRRPAKVQLLYLRAPLAIVATPTENSVRKIRNKVDAVWHAVERSCATEDFRPRPSRLCDWCGFKPYCPAHGGDPADAPVSADA